MVLLEISIQYRVVLGISAMVLLFCSFLVAFISNQRKKLQYHKNLQAIQEQQKAQLLEQNALLEQKVNERTNELKEKASTLQDTLTKLKTSQLQLIQKEKMASLGELTAGIAHEIQNPLNFVNNFAEINADIIKEIRECLGTSAASPDFAKEIDPLVADLEANLQKIGEHGKRADNIVKNMMQHSGKQGGIVELADINDLAEEYLKFSYQSFRAKNKSFTCSFSSSFDEKAGKINLVKEDIGRIFRNLFMNAFYSMREKSGKIGKDYEAVLVLTTHKKDNTIVILIRDNGIGIPATLIDKIFNPFFTTKPPGEGTGLGLSMSYDIIKAHEGELKVNAVEGEFAEFSIELPCAAAR